MSLLRHIQLCNSYTPERFVPLWHDGQRLGLVRRDNADILRRFPAIFEVTTEDVRLVAAGGFADLSAAIDDVVERLVGDGLIRKWRHEFFAAAPGWQQRPHFKIDRGAVPFFGIRAYGVHLNGYLRKGRQLKLWIGRRAPDKQVAPDKLDNLVAGGIAFEHGLAATLIKEAHEEANMPRAVINRAVPAGAVSYRMETALGLRDDVLFIYDLETPADFAPKCLDGECVGFTLENAEAMIALVREGDSFKFNVNLVLIDFALRHGLVTPDEPDYLDLVAGLHRNGD
jgi:8-oxo-dGTP pyrophosphatase MutT (NUDIX family)